MTAGWGHGLPVSSHAELKGGDVGVGQFDGLGGSAGVERQAMGAEAGLRIDFTKGRRLFRKKV